MFSMISTPSAFDWLQILAFQAVIGEHPLKGTILPGTIVLLLYNG